jgi:hypothetical protein
MRGARVRHPAGNLVKTAAFGQGGYYRGRENALDRVAQRNRNGLEA